MQDLVSLSRTLLSPIAGPTCLGPDTFGHLLCKSFDFHVTDDLYSDFFFAYSGKRWPGCCAAQFRTPRGPALIPRETVGRTSEGGRFNSFPGKPRAGARCRGDHSSAKNRLHHEVNRQVRLENDRQTGRRKKKRNYRELQRAKRKIGIAAPRAGAAVREW
jgi:hypothetical protein